MACYGYCNRELNLNLKRVPARKLAALRDPYVGKSEVCYQGLEVVGISAMAPSCVSTELHDATLQSHACQISISA